MQRMWRWAAAVMTLSLAPTVLAAAPASVSARAPVPLSAVTARLVAQIKAYTEKDQTKDPKSDLAAQLLLLKLVEADGTVPLLDQSTLVSNIGGSYFYLREYDNAIAWMRRSAAMIEAAGGPPEDVAGSLSNQGTILTSLGRLAEAEAAHRRALDIRQRIEGPRGKMVSSSLFGLAVALFRMGRIEESLELMRPAAEQQLEFSGPDQPLSIMRLASLASVLGRSGREEEAIAVARQGEALARQHLGLDHPTYAIALNNLGNALVENGLFVESLPVLRETLRLRRATVGDKASGTAYSLRNLSTALKRTGSRAEGEAVLAEGTRILEASGDRENLSALPVMYSDLADYAWQRGDRAAYESWSEKALRVADEGLADDNYERAHVHLYRAEKRMLGGDAAAALAIAERWVPVMSTKLIATHRDRLWAEMLLVRLRQLAGANGAAVLAEADTIKARVAQPLADIAIGDSQLVRDARQRRHALLLYLDIALAGQSPDRAFEALQLVNINDLALGKLTGGSQGDSPADRDRRVLLDLARRTDELRGREARAIETAKAGEAVALGKMLAETQTALGAAKARFVADHAGYAARLRPQPMTLADAVRAMPRNRMLLAPVEDGEQLRVVVIDRDGLKAHAAPLAPVRDQVAAIRAAVENPDATEAFPFAAAGALGTTLFPQGLRRGAQVSLYGGGILASLPLGLLLDDPGYQGSLARAPWFIRRASFDVGSQPGRAAAASRTASSARFIGIGGPSPTAGKGPVQVAALFRSGRPDLESIAALPALPQAADELAAIGAALGDRAATVLVGAASGEAAVKAADLSTASVIAFATHGLVAGELRGLWEPALLVGRSDDSSEDGLLGASEIARLRLSADWVILSACNTAAGSNSDAPVYSGLATAFAQAGARALLLSHWRVRDDAAARLSVATVRGAQRLPSKGAALRAAQLSLMADARVPSSAHPAIWAPFVVVEP